MLAMERLLVMPQIKELVREARYAKYEIAPLEPGLGTTLGNTLRRTLLNDILGAAITEVWIEGVPHEYTTIPGVKEDVLEIILNLKEVAIKPLPTVNPRTPYTARIQVSGEGEVTGADIQMPYGFEVANPEIHIATLTDSKASLDMQLTVKVGKGYLPLERIDRSKLPLGTIPIDAVFSPVKKVNFIVEPMRVGIRSDYDRLVLEVWTNGAIEPDQAIVEAAQLLIEHFRMLLPLGMARQFVLQELGVEEEKLLGVTGEPIEKLGLPGRIVNVLRRNGITTIRELTSYTREELLERVSGLGEQSLQLVEEKLRELGYSLREEWGD
ncbi:MAG: DNA-directed RNA polymerase subunit alpha [Candidatus Fervidibacter sp.]|uniref:DNA-directed RNA polymerase subunit alpha n=1 Tax=Candidatus Fervidibacter sp. TaxID=3100871 RepID=UPI0040493A2B